MQSQKETFQSISPRHELISQHVNYYYFHDSNDNDFSKNVIYHPHYLTALNIYKNTNIQLSPHGRTYLPCSSRKHSVVYTINKKTSKEVKMRGQFNKIGIVFNPLGLSNFINFPLSTILNDSIENFNYFGQALLNTADKTFKETTLENKRDILDSFFLSRFSAFQDQRAIEAVKLIMESNGNIKISSLAQHLEISRETLLRIFKKHLCYSVEEFKSVVKFRQALEFYEETEIKPRLTHLALDQQYYDQSAFIKHFKKVTGVSPKRFFASLRNIGNAGMYWTFTD